MQELNEKVKITSDFLQEIAKKHNCKIDEVMIGIVFNQLHAWRYNEGNYEVFKQLEIFELK